MTLIKWRSLNFLLYIFCFFVVYSNAQTKIKDLNNNKAIYKPGDTVLTKVTFSNDISEGRITLEYYHLNEIVHSDSISNVSGASYEVSWTAPPTDYKGYLLRAILTEGGAATDTSNIAIDVSSDWKRFPRYGFLSKYPVLTTNDANRIIENLTRHHINGIQYYDWHWKHHRPLKGEPGNVSSTWRDIANKTVYLSTIQKYIDACSSRGINSMAYNLLYGAYSDAANDGVAVEWRMFQDPGHQSPDLHDLPSNWASDIYLIDHSNDQWVKYINNEMDKVFKAINFTGWHIDQLGDRGTRYTYNGQQINMSGAFKPFIDTAKAFLGVPLICNAVNNYAQNNIAKTDVDFLYTEVWSPYERFSDLASIIFFNNTFSNNSKNTVLAAYVNKGKSNSPGFFNTSSVLFTNATIFAAGGSHIELGEHMLSNEYFPNSNLAMTVELKEKLIGYYDFLTAYENILRDSLQAVSLKISSDTYDVSTWPPQLGKIWVFPRAKDNMVILNVINFTEATTMSWRDDKGVQSEPALLENVNIKIPRIKEVKNIWYASADNKLIMPTTIDYSEADSTISINLPKIKYWSTIVVEFEENITHTEREVVPEKTFNLEQNFPNPFNPLTQIKYTVGEQTKISLKIFDVLGNEVADLVNEEKPAGIYTEDFTASSISSGIYFYRLQAGDLIETKKMIYLK